MIVGFSAFDIPSKWLYEYEDIKGEPHAFLVKNINPYLVDAPNVVLPRRKNPIVNIPSIRKGNQPTDGGNLILSEEEMKKFSSKNPQASKFIKKLIGAQEFLNGNERYCLWLVGASPQELRSYPFIMERVEACRKWRAEEGIASDTIALASTPTLRR